MPTFDVGAGFIGHVFSSCNTHNAYDVNFEIKRGIRVGVVLNLVRSDDRLNPKCRLRKQRSTQILADVLIVDNAESKQWYVEYNVLVVPLGQTGYWDYYEDLPTPCYTSVSDGLKDIDVIKELAKDFLDDSTKSPGDMLGDWCLVAYVGNNAFRPVMIAYHPHPQNFFDPATVGGIKSMEETGSVYLAQEPRFIRRKNGTMLGITDKGSLFVDTTVANATVNLSGGKREVLDSSLGGDIQIDVKPGRRLEIGFRGSQEGIVEEPKVPSAGSFGSVSYPHVQPVPTVKTSRTGSGLVVGMEQNKFEVLGPVTLDNGGTASQMARGTEIFNAVSFLCNDILIPLVNELVIQIPTSTVLPEVALKLSEFWNTYVVPGVSASPLVSQSHTLD